MKLKKLLEKLCFTTTVYIRNDLNDEIIFFAHKKDIIEQLNLEVTYWEAVNIDIIEVWVKL